MTAHITLQFTDPDIEHSPDVVAWLRRLEKACNERLPESEFTRLCDALLVSGAPFMPRTNETYGRGDE